MSSKIKLSYRFLLGYGVPILLSIAVAVLVYLDTRTVRKLWEQAIISQRAVQGAGDGRTQRGAKGTAAGIGQTKVGVQQLDEAAQRLQAMV